MVLFSAKLNDYFRPQKERVFHSGKYTIFSYHQTVITTFFESDGRCPSHFDSGKENSRSHPKKGKQEVLLNLNRK